MSQVLVINSGSSSLKFKLFDALNFGKRLMPVASGLVERIGDTANSRLVAKCWSPDPTADADNDVLKAHDALDEKAGLPICAKEPLSDHTAALDHVLDYLRRARSSSIATEVKALGHRVVHGKSISEPVLVDDAAMAAIQDAAELAPLHNPANLSGIKAAAKIFPGKPQVAVFDTAFHQTMPAEAYMYALPWDLYKRFHVRKYGFHGTSYSFLVKQVRAVRLRRDKIVVALEHKVLMYNFADLRLEHSTETLANPHGLAALSPAPEHNVLACPGLHCGQVRVELYDVRRTRFIQAHAAALAALTLSQDGRLLATASERGTLVRIHSTADGSKLQELRRGADPACIYSIAFSRGAQWLAVSSDKGTVHVFSLDRRRAGGGAAGAAAAADAAAGAGGGGGGGAGAGIGGAPADAGALRNPVSAFSFVSAILPVPYFASERSFAQFRLPEETRSIVGFGPGPAALVVASLAGSFYTAAFDPERGGACEQRSYCKFVELEGDAAA